MFKNILTELKRIERQIDEDDPGELELFEEFYKQEKIMGMEFEMMLKIKTMMAKFEKNIFISDWILEIIEEAKIKKDESVEELNRILNNLSVMNKKDRKNIIESLDENVIEFNIMQIISYRHFVKEVIRENEISIKGLDRK